MTANQVGVRDSGQSTFFAGRYRVVRRLAQGGGGQVYVVEQATTGAQLVLKTLPRRTVPERAQAEFAHLAGLSHPNVVKVVDAGVLQEGAETGQAFLVLDYVDGSSLNEYLAAGPPAQRQQRFYQVAESLMDALAYLHANAVVHGDISPANIRCREDGQPVLIDFGLATTIDASLDAASVSGTLGFIAPEALLGRRGPAGDLFALGATLYEAWTGTAPFGVGVDAIKRAWAGPPPPPSSLHEGLPAVWDDLLLRLLAAEVTERPANAREALREIRAAIPGRDLPIESELSVPYPAGDPLAGLVVGREQELARLRRHIENLADGAARACVLRVVGQPSSGRRTLIHKALSSARLGVVSETIPAIDIEETECSTLLRGALGKSGRPAVVDDPAGRRVSLAVVAAWLEERARSRPLCLALSGSEDDLALAEVVASNPPSGRLLVLVPCAHATDGEGSEGSIDLAVGPLSRSAIEALARRGAGRAPSQAVLDKIWAASAGLAGACVVYVRSWIQSVREGKPERLVLHPGEHDLPGLLEQGFLTLSQAARAFLLRLALAPSEELSLGDAHRSGAIEGEREARAAGWLSEQGGALPSELHRHALLRALARDERLRKVAREQLARLPEDDERVGEVYEALNEHERAATSFWAAARSARARMSWGRVARHAMRAEQAQPGRGAIEDILDGVRALGILGRYDDASVLLDSVRDRADAPWKARIAERKAWLLGRRGDPGGAQAVLRGALDEIGDEAPDAPLLRARLARLLVSSGELEQALQVAQAVPSDRTEAGVAAREAVVLAHTYAGNIEAARRVLESMVDESDAKGAALRGLVEQVAGNPGQAAQAYRKAAAIYDADGDLHGSAAATFNLGCVLAETGRFAEAIDALEHSIRDLGLLGVRTDHALAIFNVGELFLQLGDLTAANKAAARLRSAARSAGVDAFTGYASLLSANILRREGRGNASVAAYDEALAVFDRVGMQTAELLARAGRVEGYALSGDFAAARAAFDDLLARQRREHEGGPDAGDAASEQIALTGARLALADPDADRSVLIARSEVLRELAMRARAHGRSPMVWHASSLLCRLLTRAQDARASDARQQARAALEEVKMSTPARYRPGLESDPDGGSLLSGGKQGEWATPELVQRAAVLEGRLRRLLRINKRLNSDLRLSRVLETIIDTVIELTDAERGFLLLKDGSGELTVKVARNIDQTTLEGPGLALSRSIAKQAADTGQPVITVDASGDSRFSDLLSVSDLHLRSVLAVPLTVKGQVVGTLYVDHRLRKGVFGDDEVAMVLDFAEQGAIAIENARMLSELRRREQQVQSLNRRLERELRVQEAALSDARTELKESRHLAALRYDYRQIVGESTGMVDLFRLLDRVTDTNLPVVIEGESGTGKELVARAIHFHGPRKDRAFVSENCAAIPETLLESALFGHVRGAFTGADREVRGLFSVANGGTLFLDEVAEMSPAMQGKLLRVLQEGEFHRVGSERPERVDVRVLVATNKNLSRLVEEGKFRKDLFYRLSVVRLHLPALRDRREDIPLLVRHFVQKSSPPGQPKEVEPSAMSKLSAYAWPGNVRELENEIARATAFSGPSIGVSDLAAHIQNGQDPSESAQGDSDGLRLRQRVERLERHLIREAFAKAQGNQTKAATLLGLSRFGLQKKLRRYGLSGR